MANTKRRTKKKSEPPNRKRTPTQSRKDSIYTPGPKASGERRGMRQLIQGEPPSRRKAASKKQNQNVLRGVPLRGEKSSAALQKARKKTNVDGDGRPIKKKPAKSTAKKRADARKVKVVRRKSGKTGR